MRELTLTRDPEDKRRCDVPGLGTVRFLNRWGNKVELSAPGHPSLHLSGKVMLRDVTQITDQLGTGIGTFTTSTRTLELGTRTLHVVKPKEGLTSGPRPVELSEDGRVLARYAPYAWDGRKPITVELVDEEFAAAEPLLVLLGLYGALQYAINRSAAAAASDGATG